ncbi:MAG TPA: GTP 3',8-cyclase MoaA [Halanaerobiales bacterium]|nr:GTP 3',8-cyclase MoaA [Halanaerobiales bacterium]
MNNLIDNYGRRIDYLRLSVTDRCNLRCSYCMPAEGVEYKSHYDILRYEEIRDIVEVAVDLGINKVRLTGGEPLVRPGIERLVELLSAIKGLEDISITTNGTLFAKKAVLLKKAGLKRVNISLDTLDREKFIQISRRDEFKNVMKGIEAAFEYNYYPVKINTVIMKGINDNELFDFIDLIKKQPLHVRFIELMPLGKADNKEYLSLARIKEMIEEKFKLIPTTVVSNGPAFYYKIANVAGTIGFITPMSNAFCNSCNKIRLTADGKIKPCLFTDKEIDIKTGEKINKEVIRQKLIEAVKTKPYTHQTKADTQRDMNQIGG